RQLASSLEVRRTLGEAVRAAVPLIADLCFIDELADDGGLRRIEVAFADRARERLFERIRRDATASSWKSPQAAVITSGRSRLLDEHSQLAMDAGPTDLGLTSMMVVPLMARGRTLGALTLASA